jgi:CRP/FNR family cyclic AMP-dependent transcriptional regulator
MEQTLSTLEKTAFLKTTKLFASIPTDVLAQLADRARELHFDPGQVIFGEGEANHGAYVVVDGLIEIRKGRALEGVRGPGVGFSELSLAEGEPHTFSAIASQPSHLLNISNENLFDTMLDFPEVGVGMVRVLSQRMSEQAQRINDLEDEVAHLAATLRANGVEVPPYVSGDNPRPES